MNGRYIFAITDADQEAPLRADAAGFDRAPLEAVGYGSVAAIVSPISKRKLRPRRKNLKIHHEAISALMAQRPVLPMAFGMVAGDDDEVREFLARNEAHLRDQLASVRDRVELSVRMRWEVDEADFFAHVLSRSPELAAARDALYAGGREPSHEEKIAMGQRFAATLEALKLERQRALIDGLEGHYERAHVGDVRDDAEVANLAFLVPTHQASALEDAITALAGELEDGLIIKITGPLAPYNFIDVALS